MTTLSHPSIRLSIIAAMAAIALPASAGAKADASHSLGRWTVSDHDPVFSARGRPYRTIDISTCGRDTCGVSVDERGECGTPLFRIAARSDGNLRGQGRWGDGKKNLVLYANDDPADRVMELFLGDGWNFGERSGNMPKFQAAYRRTGETSCRSR